LTWWTQHVAWPLATFGAGIILLAIMWHALGQLDDFEKSMNNNLSRAPEYTEAQRQFLLAFAAAEFRLARESVGVGLPWAVTLAAAFLFELVVYLRGCGRFRLWLLSWSLAGLVVLAAVGLLGLGYGLNLAAEGDGFAPEHIRAQMLLHPYILIILPSAFVICFVSLVLLALRGIAIVLLWRHRLRPELVHTQRMTRSLGVNLKIPQFAWPRLSLAGFALHVCIVWMLVTFAQPIVDALMFGSVSLFMILFVTPLQLGEKLFNFFFAGSPFDITNTMAFSPTWLNGLAQLLVLIVVFTLTRALWRVGRRLNRRRRNEIILRDKPPVLLLRSFTDDVAGIPPNALIPRLFRRRKRLEETIGEQLTGAGPFVAIGRPGERLPQLGASRFYLDDSDWQEVVEAFIARSDLIVMIAGKTSWIQWELTNVLKQDRIAALLIVFPRITEGDRNERWQNLKAAFGDTAWSAAMEHVDIARALAVFIGADRGIVVVKSRKANQSDYEAALQVATYLMRSASPVVPSTAPPAAQAS
jgi:hypothetical protein